MPNVRISPALGYAHGHIESLLIQMGVNPPSPRRPDGIVELDLSEAQITQFQLRGNAHRIERISAASEPAAPPPPTAEPAAAPAPQDSNFVTVICPACGKETNLIKALMPTGTAETDCAQCHSKLTIEGFHLVHAEVAIPTLETVVNAGYSPEAAEKIIERQKRFAQCIADGKPAAEFNPEAS